MINTSYSWPTATENLFFLKFLQAENSRTYVLKLIKWILSKFRKVWNYLVSWVRTTNNLFLPAYITTQLKKKNPQKHRRNLKIMQMVFTALLIPQNLFFAQTNCPTDRIPGKSTIAPQFIHLEKQLWVELSGSSRSRLWTFPAWDGAAAIWVMSGTSNNFLSETKIRDASFLPAFCIWLLNLQPGALYHFSYKSFPKCYRRVLNPDNLTSS